jgi:hypothetical protein
LSRKWHIIILTVVVLSLLAVMIEFRAREELDLARSAVDHDVDIALKHYARCLSWYVPFGTAETAAEEMLTLGEKWSAEGRTHEAYLALLRMRAGLYGARWLIVPRQDLLDKAEPLLARIQAKRKLGENADPVKMDALSKKYLALMQAPLRPSTGSALAATMGFLAWIAGAIWFIRQRHGQESWQWKNLLPPVLLFAVGYIVWLWGMMWA